MKSWHVQHYCAATIEAPDHEPALSTTLCVSVFAEDRAPYTYRYNSTCHLRDLVLCTRSEHLTFSHLGTRARLLEQLWL
jgi:hypothetical protein